MSISIKKKREHARVTLAGEKGGIYMEEYVYEAGYFHFNWHDCHEIILILKGSIVAYVEGSQIFLEQDDILIINPQQGHATLRLLPHSTILLMHLDTRYFSDTSKKSLTPLFHCQSDSKTRPAPVFSLIRYYMSAIYMELSSKETNSRLIAEGFLRILYGLFLRHFTVPDTFEHMDSGTAVQRQKLKTILSYTDKHYAEKINLQTLAELTDLNYSYVSTFFKQRVGITYYEYLTRIRLKHAVRGLNNSESSVLEIALDSGFPDAKALNTAFRRYFNTTPHHYRKTLNKPDNYIDPSPLYLPFSDSRVHEMLLPNLGFPSVRSYYNTLLTNFVSGPVCIKLKKETAEAVP